MTTWTDIADALKSIVSASFSSVGFATGETPESLAQGKSMPAGIVPPCVLILAGAGFRADNTLTRGRLFHLVLIDSLSSSGGDGRATELWAKFDTLLGLFPAGGTQSGEIAFLPVSSRMLECADGRAAACLTVSAVFPS